MKVCSCLAGAAARAVATGSLSASACDVLRLCRLPVSIRVFNGRYWNTVLLIYVSTDIRNHQQNELSMFVFSDWLLTFLARHDLKAGKCKVKIEILQTVFETSSRRYNVADKDNRGTLWS